MKKPNKYLGNTPPQPPPSAATVPLQQQEPPLCGPFRVTVGKRERRTRRTIVSLSPWARRREKRKKLHHKYILLPR